MHYELKVITEIKDPNGKKPTKKIVVRYYANLNDLDVSELCDRNGKILKRKCVVTMKDGSMMFVQDNYEKLKRLKEPLVIKGFRRNGTI
jgi:hypothetical protein